MFSKTADPTASPNGAPTAGASGAQSGAPTGAAPSRGASSSVKSILGTDLRITGEVSSTGAIEVFGEIDGNITAKGLTIGQEGRVNGTLTADVVEVKGRVDGKITSGSFSMRSTAQVAADVTYASVVIESGAQIEGRFAKPKA